MHVEVTERIGVDGHSTNITNNVITSTGKHPGLMVKTGNPPVVLYDARGNKMLIGKKA